MKKEAKDNAILKAAESEFLAKGFEAAAMETIAKEAGVSKATLYKYYPTKEHLFESVLEQLFGTIKDLYNIRYDSSHSIEDILGQAIEKKAELCRDKSFISLCRMLTIEVLKTSAPNPVYLERLAKSLEWFTVLIRQCQQDGKLSSDVAATDIASCFHGIVDNILFWPLMAGVTDGIDDADVDRCKSILSRIFTESFTPALV